MIRYFVLAGTFAAMCALGFAACVSDTTTPTDAGGNETSTEAGGPCVTIASQPGVDCFSGGRCALSTQQCCTGLTGNGLVGQCALADAGCALPFPVPWTCDKGFDCPPTAGKCCATTEASQLLFASINTSDGGCPIPLHPVDVSDAGDAAFHFLDHEVPDLMLVISVVLDANGMSGRSTMRARSLRAIELLEDVRDLLAVKMCGGCRRYVRLAAMLAVGNPS